jgi:hypothetical protein
MEDFIPAQLSIVAEMPRRDLVSQLSVAFWQQSYIGRY